MLSSSFLCVKVSTAAVQGQMMWYQAMTSPLSGLQDANARTGEVSLVLLFSPKTQHRTVHIKERALNCPCPRCLTQKLIYAYFNHEPLHVGQLSLFKLNVTYSLTLHPFILTVWSHTTMWATVMLTESQFLVIGIDQQFGMPQSSSHFVINFLYQVFQLSKCILTNWSMKSVRFHFMTLI